MDTENELAEAAYRDERDRLQVVQYACAIVGCDSALVEDIGDFNRCENCSKRICEGHSRKRSAYWLCSECDRKERDKLSALLMDRVLAVAENIRDRKLNAEEAQRELFSLHEIACEIEGSN
jgi:ribosomal protein L37AE/L43A